MFLELSPGLWVLEEPLRFYGIEIGRRMIVIRLADGSLWIHSPSRLDAPTRAKLEELGTPRTFICPNPMHNAHIEQPFAHYPEARVFAPSRKPRDWMGLPFAGVLGAEPDPAWAGQVEQRIFGGHWVLDEVEFYHPASRTLILTDVCYNVQAEAPPLTRLVAGFTGMYGKLAVPPDLRVSFRDREAARATVADMLAWDFERVIVGHGAIVEQGGPRALRSAFDWL